MSNFRIGDNLVCKKGPYGIFFANDGDIMKIVDICEEYIIISGIVFTLDEKNTWYIWSWFYKPKELRKLKLNKLRNE